MTQAETLKRYLDAGMAFTQMTRDRAEAIVKELVKAGEVQREQAQDRVEELVDRGRKSSDALLELVRKEIARQLAGMGLVTRDDLAALEARLQADKAPTAPTASKARRPSPKPVAGKAAAKKPAAGKPASA